MNVTRLYLPYTSFSARYHISHANITVHCISSVGNSHRSASPRPTTLEADRELFVNFSLILCLWFEIQGLRTYNFFDWISNTVYKPWKYYWLSCTLVQEDQEYFHCYYMGGYDMQCVWNNYCKASNISRTLVGNKIVDNSDVVGASPVGAAPTTSFIHDLTPGFNGLSKDNCKTRLEI